MSRPQKHVWTESAVLNELSRFNDLEVVITTYTGSIQLSQRLIYSVDLTNNKRYTDFHWVHLTTYMSL